MDISVIIVNYNNLQLTRECIDSIREKTEGVEYEIILVDNASTDGSQEYFSQRDDITYIYNEENLGFGRANNVGYAKAKGKYLFLLNNDTLLLNNALLLFHQAMEAQPADVAGCGTLLVDKEMKPQGSYGRFTTLRSVWRRHILGLSEPSNGYGYPLPEGDNRVECICGADYFMRKNVADRYGLFDPRYFLYSEEVDMQFNYHHHGYHNVILSEPRVLHYIGQSTDARIIPFHAIRSEFLYLRKWNSPLRYYSFALAYTLVRYPAILLSRKSDWAYKKNFIRILHYAIFTQHRKPSPSKWVQ